MRARGRGVIVLFSVLLFASLFATVPTTAQEPGVGIMQSDDAKNLTSDQNRMYMYGNNNDGGSPDMWPMWTHSAATDSESDDSIGESNVVGDPNNGGGPRSFTFEGTHPVDQATGIDNSVAIVGKVKLAIFCDVESGQCSKAVDIYLRLGNRELTVQNFDSPDEDDFYAFEFFVNDDEIPAGETFGLRVQFTKPASILGGYTLYLGNGNSYMDIPVLPPYEPTVPGLDGEVYVSPYAQASGYNLESGNSTSILGLVFWGLLGIGVFVAGFMFIPPIPLRELAISFTGLGLLISMLVAPIIAGPLQMGTINPDDPDIWTIEELAQLDERPLSFLGDTFVENYEFKIYVEYDDVYITSDRGQKISAMGYEEYAGIFEDPEVPQRGKEYVQLYFSLFHIDLRPGQAVLANSMIVNSTNPATGQTTLVPLHACMDCTNPDTGVALEVQDVKVTVNGEDSNRFAIQHEFCEIIGVDSSWAAYVHIMTAFGLLLGGVGFWMSFRQSRQYDEEDEDDDDDEDLDDDFEDAFDDLEEF